MPHKGQWLHTAVVFCYRAGASCDGSFVQRCWLQPLSCLSWDCVQGRLSEGGQKVEVGEASLFSYQGCLGWGESLLSHVYLLVSDGNRECQDCASSHFMTALLS